MQSSISISGQAQLSTIVYWEDVFWRTVSGCSDVSAEAALGAQH